MGSGPWGFLPGTNGAFSVKQDVSEYNKYGGDYTPKGGAGSTAFFDASKDDGAHVRGEVRPKNVALLYCRKDRE